jgi:hypothetical protein
LADGDGAPGDLFGGSVAISQDTVLVGASRHAAGPRRAGAAYVFVRSGSAWSRQAVLTAADADAPTSFGCSVAISGNSAIIGATQPIGLLGSNPGAAGAAYVFRRSGGTWAQRARLAAPDGAAGDAFGAAVAVQGDLYAVGAPGSANPESRVGAVYIYDLNLSAAADWMLYR